MPLKVDRLIAGSVESLIYTINGQPLSGGGGVTDITYTELYSKVINEELIPGSWYRLTDYKSVNFLNGWEIANNNPTPNDPNFNPQEIYEGETEVLLLQAISSYQISEIGYSETFQGDIVQYQPYTNKIGVDIGGIYNGQTLPDSSTVSGFDLQWDGTNVYFNMPTGYPALFGHYFYLYCEFNDGVDSYYQDGAFEPLTPIVANCQYSYTSDDIDYGYPKAMSRMKVVDNGMKVILLDLVEADYLNYQTDSLYVNHVYALGDAYGWITKRIDTLRNITAPLDFRGRKYRRFEVDLSAVNPSLGTGYYGQGDNYLSQGTTGNFKDFKVFRSDGSDTYIIEWNDMGGADMYWYCGYNDNSIFLGICNDNKIGAYFYNNTIENQFVVNRIGSNFNNNTIRYSFYFNTIGNSFNNNTIGDSFYFNTIGNNFYYNTIGHAFTVNTIGINFYYNTIGNSFYNNSIGDVFYQNNIGNSFQYNTIGNEFYTNTIGDFFEYNTIGNYFYQNTIGTDFYLNTIVDYFYQNTIGNNFRWNTTKYLVSSTDFSLSTYVYADYNCEIFRRSDSTLRLSYYDSSDVLTITDITN